MSDSSLSRRTPTKQETFTKIVTHLRHQGCRAYSQKEGCLFLDEYGNKCAVGCLIPGDLYSSEFEDQPINTGVKNTLMRLLNSLGYSEHMDLLIDMQRVHDDDEPNDWEREFVKTASKHGLVVPERATKGASL